MEFNSDDQSLAENKILLLYILSKVGKPISHNELLELVLSIVDMNYFYFQQFLLDLLEDNYINQYKKDDISIYEITDKGLNAIDFTIDIIPGILKLQIDSKFNENLTEIKDKFSVSAEYSPITDKSFSVRCKIIENNQVIFDLQTDSGSREQSQQIVENWNNNAAEIYQKIFEILVNSVPDDKKEDK